MSTPDRTTIVKGAGAVKIGSVQLYAKGDIDAVLNPETFDVEVAGYGALDTRFADNVGRISFTPSGRLSADILAALYPYANPVIDGSIYGATDTASEVHSIAGQKFVFHNTAVASMPNLKLSARNTHFSGNCELIALPKNETARSEANAIFTGPTGAAFTPSLAANSIPTLPYAAAWGTTDIYTKEGWDIEFSVELEQFTCDDYGTIDFWLKSVSVMCKCQPVNLSEAILTTMRTQGSAAVIGSTMRETKDLTIAAAVGGLTFEAYDAIFKEGPLKWGQHQLRAGQIGFAATRSFDAGAPDALFSIAMTAA